MQGRTVSEILILTTGGTIDKIYFDDRSTYEIGDSIAEKLLEDARVTLAFDVSEVLKKDSLEMTDADRDKIIKAVTDSGASKIIITHGTDTMTTTGKALIPHAADKTIVLTGSLAPARFALTDATFNLGMAMGAVQALDQGVYIVMNGTLFNADSVIKNTDSNTFERR